MVYKKYYSILNDTYNLNPILLNINTTGHNITNTSIIKNTNPILYIKLLESYPSVLKLILEKIFL
jgi:hypothetical protein